LHLEPVELAAVVTEHRDRRRSDTARVPAEIESTA
jgi:hypothetical protein